MTGLFKSLKRELIKCKSKGKKITLPYEDLLEKDAFQTGRKWVAKGKKVTPQDRKKRKVVRMERRFRTFPNFYMPPINGPNTGLQTTERGFIVTQIRGSSKENKKEGKKIFRREGGRWACRSLKTWGGGWGGGGGGGGFSIEHKGIGRRKDTCVSYNLGRTPVGVQKPTVLILKIKDESDLNIVICAVIRRELTRHGLRWGRRREDTHNSPKVSRGKAEQ